jgi:hypothetical protein
MKNIKEVEREFVEIFGDDINGFSGIMASKKQFFRQAIKDALESCVPHEHFDTADKKREQFFNGRNYTISEMRENIKKFLDEADDQANTQEVMGEQ